jgi:DNA-binding transcriptional LysR family regulator
MSLSSLQLEAFAAVANTGSFSAAAKELHISQSALSQRVLNLESTLMTALIIRDPSGLRLTPAGVELLRYCKQQEQLESEVLHHISSGRAEPAGKLRIAGFSSITRSALIPTISELARNYPSVSLEIFCREMRDLGPMLWRHEADLIITSLEPTDQSIECHHLGSEELVLVTSRHLSPQQDRFLDHDLSDQTTKKFFTAQGEIPKQFIRHYLDEIYTIIDGVKNGLGQAVLPFHLVKADGDLMVQPGYRPVFEPVLLQYIRQPYYSRLHHEAVKYILEKIPSFLSKP